MAMAAVGATNVGSIEVFYFSPDIAVSCLSVDVLVAVFSGFNSNSDSVLELNAKGGNILLSMNQSGYIESVL
jgi:phosphatidylserine decarboxylase